MKEPWVDSFSMIYYNDLSERFPQLQQSVAEADAKAFEAYRRNVWDGETQESIAVSMGVTRGTVNCWVQKVLKMLGQDLGYEWKRARLRKKSIRTRGNAAGGKA
jgi:DNA-directed RNA polymerase specialized sigma24 family protein